MAKAIKPRVTTPIVTVPPVIEVPVIKEEPKVIEPVIEVPKVEEVIVPPISTVTVKPIIKEDEDLTKAQRIVNFITESQSNPVRINEFIKSLYGMPSYSEPAKWLSQGECKHIRGILMELVSKNEIKVTTERYLLLGKSYYFGTDQLRKHYTLTDIEIICQK